MFCLLVWEHCLFGLTFQHDKCFQYPDTAGRGAQSNKLQYFAYHLIIGLLVPFTESVGYLVLICILFQWWWEWSYASSSNLLQCQHICLVHFPEKDLASLGKSVYLRVCTMIPSWVGYSVLFRRFLLMCQYSFEDLELISKSTWIINTINLENPNNVLFHENRGPEMDELLLMCQ